MAVRLGVIMTVTNRESGTDINEIAENIYRINTPVDIAGGFWFNQYLIVDDASLIFHTGLHARKCVEGRWRRTPQSVKIETEGIDCNGNTPLLRAGHI